MHCVAWQTPQLIKLESGVDRKLQREIHKTHELLNIKCLKEKTVLQEPIKNEQMDVIYQDQTAWGH